MKTSAKNSDAIMSAKHTPGPWIVQSVPWQESLRVVGGANALDTVAGIISNADDAALIAYAPDLLAERGALRAQVATQAAHMQELREVLEQCATALFNVPIHDAQSAYVAAVAALAKVTP